MRPRRRWTSTSASGQQQGAGGPGLHLATALDTSQASLDAAQATYQAALAAADVARKALDDTVLRSPIDGQVAQRLAQPGERVGVDARMLEVVDLSRLELEALLSPADSLAVRVGQKARCSSKAVASQVDRPRVVRINPSAQAGQPHGAGVPGHGPQQPGLRQGLFVQGTLRHGPRSAGRAAGRRAHRQAAPYVQVVEAAGGACAGARPARVASGGETWWR
jgi:multidrug efflux pump subunit AcrA (membrane-fusion protein)